MAENFPYSDKVMDHFMNPRNMGEIENPDGVGTVGNPACGDVMRLFVKIEGNKIVDAKFKTFGCGAAIATSSMTTEMVKGKTIEEALGLSNQTVAEALDGLPPVKMHCSVLAEDALKSAIEDYLKKHPEISLSDTVKELLKKKESREVQKQEA
jgi:nitrogen fixation protein NifU and related proteins